MTILEHLELTAFVLEDAATVIGQTSPELARVWMKQVRRAREVIAANKPHTTSVRGDDK